MHAPPKRGAMQWKDKRSAKELARYWTAAPLADAIRPIENMLGASFGEISFEEAWPEQKIYIDSFPGEQRNCDLVIQAISSVVGKIRIHVEAKSDERFGDDVIGPYYDKMLRVQGSNLPSRMKNLVSAVFGCDLTNDIRALRYQLLHSTYAACLDAESARAKAAIFLVHEFSSSRASKSKMDDNAADWNLFLSLLLKSRYVPFQSEYVYGPVQLPFCSIPLYVGKWTTDLD